MPEDQSEPLISIVIPLWNEAEGIPALLLSLQQLARGSSICWEFVFVNDGSSDATQALLEQNLGSLPRARLIKLARNFGQQSAYRAGLNAASGEAVVFMDGDLQDPPRFIPDLVQAWKEGAKVVVGCRKTRRETGLRRLFFDLFHHFFYRITGGVMPKNSGTFGLMDRVVADHLKQIPEVNVFLPALRSWIGFEQKIIFYDREARAQGDAKQSFSSLFRYAWDGITSFSNAPLHAISFAGVLISLLSFSYGMILIGIKLCQVFGAMQDLEVPGFTTLAVSIFFMGGLQLISLGVLGQYLARVYSEVKRRPSYIIESVQGSPGSQQT